MNSDEYHRRYNALLDLVSRRLPNFIEAAPSKETDTLVFHQDAFAADLQNEELMLLAAAIDFAGHQGKAITINGRCGETIKDSVVRARHPKPNLFLKAASSSFPIPTHVGVP